MGKIDAGLLWENTTGGREAHSFIFYASAKANYFPMHFPGRCSIIYGGSWASKVESIEFLTTFKVERCVWFKRKPLFPVHHAFLFSHRKGRMRDGFPFEIQNKQKTHPSPLSATIPGWFTAFTANARLRHHRRGHRPAGLLHLRRVGHHEGAGRAQRKVLQLLRRTISGHNIQHNAAPQDALLHGQSDNTVRRHFVFVGAGVLLAQRFGRKDFVVYQHSAVVDRVLLAAGGDHSADVADGAAVRKVSIIYDDVSHAVGCGDGCSAER